MRERRRHRGAMICALSITTAAVGLSAVPTAGAAPRSQWAGAATYGIGFNNPISAWANDSMWQSMNASVSMRQPLMNLGYTSDQLDHMSADEMIAALRGGKPGGGSAASATVVTIAPQTTAVKVQVAKGTLAGISFPVTTATKFVPVKKRLVTKQLVAAITSDPAAQAAVNEVIEAGLKAYDREAAADGLQNDVAGSMMYFIGTCDLIANDGKEPDPEGLVLVARMLQQQFETPQHKKVPSADKQKMHEFLVGFGSVVLATYGASKENGDTATVAALKDGCTTFGKTMLKADLSQLEITGFGLEKRA